jgi:hypothetical protein
MIDTHGTTSLQDERALEHLTLRYARACDRRDGPGLASVFAPGAVLRGPGFKFSTPAELANVPQSLQQFEKTYHTLLNYMVEVDGDHATGEAYSMAHHLTPLGTGKYNDLVMYITYRDRYVRGAAGWRILEREVVIEFTEHRSVEKMDSIPKP